MQFHWKYKNQKLSEKFLTEEDNQNYWSFYVNNNLCVCVYKIFNITKETLKNNGIQAIVDSVNALWLNEKI